MSKLEAGRGVGHIAGGGATVMPLSAASLAAKERHDSLIAALAKRKRARELALPTNDNEVKLELRQLGEPICVFSEGPPERRERLREVLAAALAKEDAAEGDEGGGLAVSASEAILAAREAAAELAGSAVARAEPAQAELFYTEGTSALRAARLEIAADSLRRASARLAAEQAARSREPDPSIARALSWGVRAAERAVTQLVGLQPQHSASPDERPLSALALSQPHSANGPVTLAVGGWGGSVRLISLPLCTQVQPSFRAHTERIGGLAFHPDAASRLSRAADAGAHDEAEGAADAAGGEGGLRSCSDLVCLATAGGDGVARLWPARPEPANGHAAPSAMDTGEQPPSSSAGCAEVRPLLELKGHVDRLGRCAFHPAGGHLATASFDGTWRLWDVRTGTELLLQEGHSRAVYCLAFQADGALVASAGLDALVRVWDCRTGKCAHARWTQGWARRAGGRTLRELPRGFARAHSSPKSRPLAAHIAARTPAPHRSLFPPPRSLARSPPRACTGVCRRFPATTAASSRSPPRPMASPSPPAPQTTPSGCGTAGSAARWPSLRRTRTSSRPWPLEGRVSSGRMRVHGCSPPPSTARCARGTRRSSWAAT